MDMAIELTAGDRVDAVFDGLRVVTDQDGSAPAPFDLFLASIGTCAGIYVARFCRQRGVPSAGIRIAQRAREDEATGLIGRIEIDIVLPEGFPERYREAVVRAASLCTVKKHLAAPPAIDVRAVHGGPEVVASR